MANNKNRHQYPGSSFNANEVVSVSILNGATESEAFNLAGYRSGVVILPAAFDGTGALSLKVSDSQAGTFVPLYKADGSAVAAIAAAQASRAYPLPVEIAGAVWGKLVAGSQTGDTTGIMVCLSA